MAKLSGWLAVSTKLLYLTLLLAFDLQEKELLKAIESAGYPNKVHHVTTVDNYKLTMHRIEHKKLGRRSGEEMYQQSIALLLHGMMKTSASFINQGPNRDFAYHLADAGYDVWLGNARGSPYSRAHAIINPDDDLDKSNFFQFSWEEIGTLDIPAMVEYITATTGAERITFVGDAEGATAFLILNSLKPEYNERFTFAVLLSPVGYMSYFPSAELKTAANMIDTLYTMAQDLGMDEISSLNLRGKMDGRLSSQFIIQIVSTYIASLSGFSPIGTSLRQIVHYAQNVRDRSFRRWNYGQTINKKVYGADVPTPYNLSRITVETVMYYHLGDSFLDERDVQAMADDMPVASAIRINGTDNPLKYLADLT